MTTVLLATFLTVSSHIFVSSGTLANTLNRLQIWAPQNVEFKVEKSAIKFSGCKQKEYLASVNQLITKDIMLEMSLGYAKCAHSWGVIKK